jgi:hypothetical protein
MITLLIEATIEGYIWDEYCADHDIDPENPEPYDIEQFVDAEFGITPDSVRML